MLYFMWTRHHLRPGEFWELPRGEQLLLLAFSEKEMKEIKRLTPR